MCPSDTFWADGLAVEFHFFPTLVGDLETGLGPQVVVGIIDCRVHFEVIPQDRRGLELVPCNALPQDVEHVLRYLGEATSIKCHHDIHAGDATSQHLLGRSQVIGHVALRHIS